MLNPVTQRARLAIALVLMIACAACSDDTLTRVAKALADVRAANSAIQTTVINSFNAGLITKDRADAIVTINKRISEAGLRATNATKNVA